jgi:hypothetical protein
MRVNLRDDVTTFRALIARQTCVNIHGSAVYLGRKLLGDCTGGNYRNITLVWSRSNSSGPRRCTSQLAPPYMHGEKAGTKWTWYFVKTAKMCDVAFLSDFFCCSCLSEAAYIGLVEMCLSMVEMLVKIADRLLTLWALNERHSSPSQP